MMNATKTITRWLTFLLCIGLVFACLGCNTGGGDVSDSSQVLPSDESPTTTTSSAATDGSTTGESTTTDAGGESTTTQPVPVQSVTSKDTTAKTTTTTAKKTTTATTTKGDGFKGTTYYVSSSAGSDWNDGDSEAKPVASLAVAGTLGEPGDRVLFKRGDIWRGDSMSLRKGVTYGAYGSGEKPKFYGSAKNYADKSKWKQTSNSRVWYYDEPITEDIGGIVFNEGADYATRQFKESDLNAKNEYYYGKDGKVYLFSRNGNPGELWNSIEFIPDIMTMNSQGITDVTVKDIIFRYIGRNAFHATGTIKNLRIENCEFQWLGGVLWGPTQGEIRLGNGITLWGSCYNVVVTNCKFDQIFDTAFTPQYSNASCMQEIVYDGIEFSNNVVSNCQWSTEFWIDTKTPDGKRTGTIKNIKILNNVMCNAGGGWSATQRGAAGGLGSACHIETFGEAHPVPNVSNILIKGNTFDWSAGSLLGLRWSNCVPTLEGNTYIQKKGKLFGYIGANRYTFDDAIKNSILKLDKTATVKFAD